MANNPVIVLQLISGLDIGGGHGGAERFGIELSRRLDKTNFKVFVWAFWEHKTSYEQHWLQKLEMDNIPVNFGSNWRGKFNFFSYLSGVRNIIRFGRTHQIDIVHSHFQMGTLAALCMKIFRATKFVIRTAHITLEWGEGLVAWFMRTIFTNWLFPFALDQEVGVSKAVQRQLQNHPGARLLRRKPKLIYNAINIEDFQDPTQMGKPESAGLIVGSVGRLVRQKGYRYLLHAAKDVLLELPNVNFILIGDGNLRSQLSDFATREGFRERIKFLGQIDDVRQHLQTMDLFVLPSLWEGFPTVLLESMASGVPIVATNVRGTNELVADGMSGWLVEPGNPRALANAIIHALSVDEERNRIIENASKMVQKYSITNITEHYVELYRRLYGTKHEL